MIILEFQSAISAQPHTHTSSVKSENGISFSRKHWNVPPQIHAPLLHLLFFSEKSYNEISVRNSITTILFSAFHSFKFDLNGIFWWRNLWQNKTFESLIALKTQIHISSWNWWLNWNVQKKTHVGSFDLVYCCATKIKKRNSCLHVL